MNTVLHPINCGSELLISLDDHDGFGNKHLIFQ